MSPNCPGENYLLGDPRRPNKGQQLQFLEVGRSAGSMKCLRRETWTVVETR